MAKKKKKKKDEKTSITIVRMKLARPIGIDVNEFWDAINECGYQCDVARNAMIRHWMRWREDHPAWTPNPLTDKAGNPLVRKSGLVMPANLPAPSVQCEEKEIPYRDPPVCRWCRGDDKAKAVVYRLNNSDEWEPVCEKHRQVTFSTMLYRQGVKAAPDVSATLQSVLASEVWDHLKSRARFVPGNKAMYVWESYVLHEANVPSYRSRRIPVPWSGLAIGWDDCCWITFPLWSRAKGLGRYKVECKVGNLPAGKKRMLQAVIACEIQACDSYLVDRGARNGSDWELHLVIRTASELSNLDPERAIILRAGGGEDSRPFSVELPDGTIMGVGAGVPLVKEHERLTIRRKAIRAAGRMGAMKGGHGERRVMAKVTSESRRYMGVQSAFHRDLADRVYRIAVNNNCGKVIYHEPPVSDRGQLWFAFRDTPFDWAQQKARIIGKMKRRGIEVVDPSDGDGQDVAVAPPAESVAS